VGVTVNSFTSVSLTPPLILFCLDRAAKSHRDFTTSGRFAVSVLEEGQQHLSRGFANSPWTLWDEVEQFAAPSGAPIIKNALAWVDCETEAVHRGGDHDILLGRVVALGHSGTGRPLLYWRGKYQRLDGQP
jgi:3-hydroxy-9,10-secoandrosta-1,3,5(10)-triene-9,17-dione monooxygenase reductase component